FSETAAKHNQPRYPPNANAHMPRSGEARKITPGVPETTGYLVQTGPFSSDTTYTRVLGGTTMHWEAKVLRMLPEDFELRKKFGQGEDWPLTYQDLESYYEFAEREIGVSVDFDDQENCGLKFPKGYVFPRRKLPLSFLDQQVGKGIDGTKVKLFGEEIELRVRTF